MLLKSRKKRGKFEAALIDPIKEYFQQKGYSVSTNSRLNIAWSKIISDIDITATSHDEVIFTEIKSDHDSFYRGFDQLEKVKGFADELYIATNRNLKNLNLLKWKDDTIGLLHVQDNEVSVVRLAKKLSALPDTEVFSRLKKKCLSKLVRLLDIPTYRPKRKIEQMLRSRFAEDDLRIIAKRIAFCDKECERDCILEPFFVAVCNSITSEVPN